ncbi:MAG TPA: DUF4157 domain-containing protein, partial [Chthoniobacterales bacterium]
DVVFGAGQYRPHSSGGRRLLAHELAHVVQQGNGDALQGYGTSQPGDRWEQQASLAEEVIMSGNAVPPLSGVTQTLQRQTGDPFSDPFGEGEKKKKQDDPATARANEGCGEPCGSFPWVEVAPDHVFALCNDKMKMFPPDITPVGCPPGGRGKLVFHAGVPAAWAVPAKCDACVIKRPGRKPKPTPPGLQIGYIQTVEKALSGGVYFKRKNPTGKWEWADNHWFCVSNARDGHPTAKEPWYGPDIEGNARPEPFGTCPIMADSPRVELESHKGGASLRRMRIDGIFNTWLIAHQPKKPVVFIHHWKMQCWVVADLNEDADPCYLSGWKKMNMNKPLGSGPGKGPDNPVLTGDIANVVKKKC